MQVSRQAFRREVLDQVGLVDDHGGAYTSRAHPGTSSAPHVPRVILRPPLPGRGGLLLGGQAQPFNLSPGSNGFGPARSFPASWWEAQFFRGTPWQTPH
jgi:hypothetical protein